MAPLRQAIGSRRISARLIVSYILDWVAIVAIALIGYGFYHVHPAHHDFSLLDLSISYPRKPDTVSISVAAVVAVIFPAAVTVGVVFLFVPGPTIIRRMIRERAWRSVLELKLWEWNTAWMGLALSLASAFTITQGAKLFGKPRPNMIARCQPDLSRVADFTVGGYGQDISNRWVLVSWDICTNPDTAEVNDGFQSWPSGHSSLAWSGLLYLSLWLCAKFAVVLPYLPVSPLAPEPGTSAGPPWSTRPTQPSRSHETARAPMLDQNEKKTDEPWTKNRDEAAAPPVWVTIMLFIPCGGAVYICGSRYFDYAHHGFDIISGAVIGIVTSYVAFRWYQLPVSQGSGWSWGPRSRERAFGVGVGSHGYVAEDRTFHRRPSDDVEMDPINKNGGPVVDRSQIGVAHTPADVHHGWTQQHMQQDSRDLGSYPLPGSAGGRGYEGHAL